MSEERFRNADYAEALREAALARAEFERTMLRVADSIAGKLTAEFGDEITVTYDLGPLIHEVAEIEGEA